MSKSTSGDEDRTIRRPLQPFDRQNRDHLTALVEVAERGLMALRGSSGVIEILQDEYRIAVGREIAVDVMIMAARRAPECGESADGTAEQWEDEEVTRALVFAAGFTVAEAVSDFAELWGGYEWRPAEHDTYAASDEVDNNILLIQRELTRAQHLLHMAHGGGAACDEEIDQR